MSIQMCVHELDLAK